MAVSIDRVVAGIDVGKRNLDVSVNTGRPRRFANTEAGIARLLAWLKSQEVVLAVCEPTGGYERGLVSSLRNSPVKLARVHPNKVRSFARAFGCEAKTDALDAAVLSMYGQLFTETLESEDEPEREALKEMLSRRRQLVSQRTAERNRLDKRISAGVRDSTQRHIRWLDDEIKRVDRLYKKALRSESRLAERAGLYQSVPGVGELTAATLTAYLPELGRRSTKALASLCGLAPWARDSGSQRRYRATRGGRSVVRNALYMAALTSLRRDGSLKRFYQRLRDRGKPGKVALVALMRKLLLHLNAVARRGTPWTENHDPTSQTA